jgi:hypothetical protein
MISIKNEAALTKRFAALAENIDRQVGIMLVMIGTAVHVEVVTATPWRTGRARTGWTLSLGAPDSYVPDEDMYHNMQSGTARATAMRDADTTLRPLLAPGADVYTVVFDTNGVPYIEQLNAGSSRQAPADYVARAVTVVAQMFRSGLFQRRLSEIQ